MPKISKKVISTTIGLGVTAAIGVPIGLGINSATKEQTFSNYEGSLTSHTDDLTLRPNSNDKIPEITSAYFNFGKFTADIPHLKDWQALVAKPQTPEVIKQEEEFSQKIDNTFESLRKKYGINPTVTINTKIMSIKNDYFDMFGWKDTTDFFNWFINDVSWGPELQTLREFDIVRGVSRDGTMLTLGGHSGTRESTMIQFFPDSFFGVQNIYDGSDKSILVDTSNLNLSANKDVIRNYVNPFIDILAKNKKALYASDFETNQTISDEILNIKTIENYIEIFDGKTLSKLSAASEIEGSTSDKQSKAVDGGFPSFDDFLTYVSGKGEVVAKDTIKNSDGDVLTVYPKRYLRRILTVLYGYYSKANLSGQDTVRKLINDRNADYSEYFKKGDTSQIDALVDLEHATTLQAADGSGNLKIGPTKSDVIVQPYVDSVEFIEAVDSARYVKDNPKLSGDKLVEPIILGGFNNFSSELPKDQAVTIGKIIRQSTKMNVVNTVTSANKDLEGKNKVSLLFEKYKNLVDTMKDFKSEHNWAPIGFNNGQPNLNEFIPNLYLYKYQKREHGFLDYAISATKKFSTDEISTAKFVKREIKSLGIDFSKEQIDVNTSKQEAALIKNPTITYEKDLQKIVDNIPAGIDQPLVKKYFEYEARSKTKIKKIGIEWLKYVASHEYGHHQTLQYAKDVSYEQQKPKEGFEGVYDMSHDEITSGATINAHGYEDTYSRNYLNGYLRSRSGKIENLDPKRATGKFTPLDETIATMQIDDSAAKDDPYFAFLFHNNGKNRFTKEETDENGQPTKAPTEKGVYSYADFLTSWRAFKNPAEFLEALQIEPSELATLRGKLDGESNIAYVAYLLNALDESSYSLNPTIMAPIAPFSEGTNRPIDPMTTDAKDASKIDPLNIINGWTGFDGTDTSISPKIRSLFIDDDLGYNTLFYKNGADDTNPAVLGRVAKGDTGEVLKHQLPIPTSIVPEMSETIKDLDITDGTTSKALFENAQILSPTTLGVPYKASATMSSDITKLDSKFDGDIRKATDMFLTLKVDYSGTDPVYYLPDSKDPKAAGLKTEKILVSSTTFKTVPLMGISKENIIDIASIAYNGKNGGNAWDSATAKQRYDFFREFVVGQINQSELRLISANLPIDQLSNGKKTYTEWFEKGFGMEGVSNTVNVTFRKSYGEYLFQTYYKNFGRFLEYQKDYTGDAHKNDIVPTTYLVTAIGTSKVTSNKLNDVYASFLSQGSYSFFGQLMANYQINIAETINRDLNQLIYSPTAKPLQDGVSSEAYDGKNFALPPIFTSTFGSDGGVNFVSGMGAYDKDKKVLVLSSKKSGYFEDLALRRELDASLYILDIDKIEIFYRDAITADDKKYKDENGADITNPDDWAKAYDRYGSPLSTAGKAMVNFYKDTSGAVLDRDLSGFYVDKYFGLGQMFGYISKADSEKYDHIAFVKSDGTAEYIGITKNMSNQFFNKYMRAADTIPDDQKVPIGDGYYDQLGKWIPYSDDDKQIGWASDQFLADSFANALLQAGSSYKVYFTKGESLDVKRPMQLGSLDVLSTQPAPTTPTTPTAPATAAATGVAQAVDDTDKIYGTTHVKRTIFYNNGYDVYSGKFEITVNKDGDTILRVRRDNDE